MGRATLDELAEAAGRDPHSIQVTVYGLAADQKELKRYDAAGADRAIVRLSTTLEGEALAELERMAQQVFG
jgi:hypothetical protein